MSIQRGGSFLVAVLMLCAQGCVPLVIGAAAGGYVVSNDAAEAPIECNYPVAWEAAHNTLTELGTITYERESAGAINGFVEGASVRIRIVSLGPDLQRIVVSARKNWMPAPKVAQRIFLVIYQKLKYTYAPESVKYNDLKS